LAPIASGAVELFGRPLANFSDWRKIGYLPQKSTSLNPLFPISVEETVFLGLLAGKCFPKRITADDRRLTEKVLKELDIFELREQMLTKLSIGQQQRVLLARALVNQPEFLIFDEPTTALDPDSREAFFILIEKLNKEQGVTIIIITHDTGYIGRFAERFLYLDKNLVYFGSFRDFCGSKGMAAYFGERAQHIICHQHD
jgi:zinc transport system ATP-binding protein